MKNCSTCGSTLELVEIPSGSFNTRTGKEIVNEYKICLNENCRFGKKNYCYFIKGGHKLMPGIKILSWSCVIGIILSVPLKAPLEFVAICIGILIMIFSLLDIRYCKCGWAQNYDEFEQEYGFNDED